ncbi:MAG: preprotein translocase subunit SecY [Lachnospiraceae bacterium]|nr:preprotein translocase subunit SecY [Lachnospiraceae bacterium]
MIKTLVNAFKIKEIRGKLFFTFLMLLVLRIGAQLPIPGTDSSVISSVLSQYSGSFGFFDAMTGGSFSDYSVFALSITPYITSSIIIQLLTIAIPKLEEMQREGEEGRKKLAAGTRYLTVALALIESIAMAIGFGNLGLFGDEYTFWNVLMSVFSMTAGSAAVMWIGEQITEFGVGNGISMVLLFNIVSRIPEDIASLFTKYVSGQYEKGIGYSILGAVVIIAIIVFVVAFVVVLNAGERRIPVQYSQKVVGRRMIGGNSSYIPLKVNTSSVIPVIFASSLMQFPVIIANLFGSSATWTHYLTTSYWFNLDNMQYTIGFIVYVLLIVFFSYFYTSITFNPMEVSNNMKKQGGFIPGIRPGAPTTDYLNKILGYVVFIGAVGLIIVATVPIFFSGVFGADISFGGTSLIIIVGVVLETMKAIESMMVVRNYRGFLAE